MTYYVESMKNHVSFLVLLLCLIWVLVGCKGKPEQAYSGALKPASDTQTEYLSANKNGTQEKNIHIPEYVYEILVYIRTHNNAPKGYVGGRTFHNRERHLPETEADGSRIRYREWDVHPKVRGRNRGPERLITSKRSAYYTKDHYKTFIYINETFFSKQ